jgi:hypothetical protein
MDLGGCYENGVVETVTDVTDLQIRHERAGAQGDLGVDGMDPVGVSVC